MDRLSDENNRKDHEIIQLKNKILENLKTDPDYLYHNEEN
jgi:hypothetical protein